MRILTREQVIAAEGEAANRPDVSSTVLMQRSGYAVAQFCLSQFKFRTACVVCGKGRNGGIGMVAAGALSAAADLQVAILANNVNQLSADTAAMCSRLPLEPIWVPDEETLMSDRVREALSADLILDAVAGADLELPLKGFDVKVVEAINEASGTVVAVDIPSGVDSDSTTPLHQSQDAVVFAHGIVTFVAPKPAHVFGELTSGPVAVSEIGVQPVLLENNTILEIATGQEVAITFPPRRKEAHKGEFGHVLVIAGSRGKAGAAGLAGIAALRTSAGLVTVACPSSIQATVAAFAPEMMTEGLPETEKGSLALAAGDELRTLLADKDVIVIGPGLSRHPETSSLVRELVKSSRLPIVLDADGLNAFDGHYDELKRRENGAPFRVFTPHPGEAGRLLGLSTAQVQQDRLRIAQRIAGETGSCVVLKGSGTVVAGASGETWVNRTGNAAMAKGGSGDVLSGIIGAALARRRETESYFLQDVSVAASVYLHGLAGDFARDLLHENTVLATDLLEALTEAFRDCESQAEKGLFYLQK